MCLFSGGCCPARETAKRKYEEGADTFCHAAGAALWTLHAQSLLCAVHSVQLHLPNVQQDNGGYEHVLSYD